MVAPTSSTTVALSANSVAAGNSLTYTWAFYEGADKVIIDPSNVLNISIDIGSLAIDASAMTCIILEGSSLLDASGALVTSASSVGYLPSLVTGILYSSTVTVFWVPAAAPDLPLSVTGQVTSKVLSAPTGIPVASWGSYDSYVKLTLNPTTISQFVSQCAGVDASGNSTVYTGMNVIAKYNVKSSQGSSYGSGFQTKVVTYDDYVAAGGLQIDLSNNVSTEFYAQLTSTLGVGLPSAGTTTFATNRPVPPTVIAAMSTFEYNRDASGQSQLNVADASSVTLLWQNPLSFDQSTTYYEIYRVDLSSNGTTTIPGTSGIVGRMYTDASSSYPYYYPNSPTVVYSYKFTDDSTSTFNILAAPVPGRFYGYSIRGSNVNGLGLFSSIIGVKDGSKCTNPVIHLIGEDHAIVIEVTPPTSPLGGFDLSTNYTITYTDTSNNITVQTTQTLDASSNLTLTGLTNGISYLVAVYAETTNIYYTLPNTVVGNQYTAGVPLTYLSVSANSSATPYQQSAAPRNVTGTVLDASSNPLGYVRVSWVSDTSFNNNSLGFIVTRIDASGVETQVTDLPPANPNANPPTGNPPQYYNDQSVILGKAYRYFVQSYYYVNSVKVISDDSAKSLAVIPFTYPEQPSSVSGAFNSNLTLTFLITPSTDSYPTNSGGLLPIHYYAGIFVYDSSTQVISPNPVYSYSDCSAGVLVTTPVQNPSIFSANQTYAIVTRAYVIDLVNSLPYSSLSIATFLPRTSSNPIINTHVIDASGILTITTTNNGSILNFAEAIIIDTSNVLQLSINQSLVPGTTTNYMTVVSNTINNSTLIVNFNDPRTINASQMLVVITNSSGAAVYNTL